MQQFKRVRVFRLGDNNNWNRQRRNVTVVYIQKEPAPYIWVPYVPGDTAFRFVAIKTRK